MNFSAWTEHCQGHLHNAGFVAIKPHRFGRVRDGVLQIIDFQGRKSDIYIWRNAVPLSLPEMNLGMGCPPASGRFPGTPDVLTAESEKEVAATKVALGEILAESVIPALDSISSLDRLETLLAESEMANFAFFFRGFSLLQYNDVEAGKTMLQTVPEKPYPTNWRKHIDHFTSIPDSEVGPEIQRLIKENVKRLRLRKLLK